MVELKISNCMKLVGVWMPFDDNKLETRVRIGTLYQKLKAYLIMQIMDSIVIIVISIFSECQTYRGNPSKYCSFCVEDTWRPSSLSSFVLFVLVNNRIDEKKHANSTKFVVVHL